MDGDHKIWLPPKPAIVRAVSLDGVPSWESVEKRVSEKRSTFPMPFFRPSSTPITVAYGGSASSSSDLSSYSFASVPISTAVAGRVILVGVASTGSGNDALSSGTIGGVAATVHVTTGATINASFMSAVVPTGTTATIDVVFAGGRNRCGIAAWAIYGRQSPTPIGSVNNNSANGSFSQAVSTQREGASFGIAALRNTAGTPSNAAWTNVSTDFNDAIETFLKQSGGYALTTGASLTVSHNGSGTQDASTSLISFR